MSLWSDIVLGEGKHTEFKVKLPSGNTLVNSVIAFSNTGGGRIIIGVADEGEVMGLEPHLDLLELQDRIASMIHDQCHPNVLPDIYTATVEGKMVMVIEIFRGNLLPYFVKSLGKSQGTYIRIGSTNRVASSENIRELERQRMNISFDQEISREWDFESLDLAPLMNAFSAGGKSLDLGAMKNLRLIEEENGKVYPTNGLLILLGKLEHVRIKCSRFKGNTMDVFIDRKEYSGDLFHQLVEAENFIKNHISLRGEIKGLQRNDHYEIPLEAIRESLVNAVVHRDYSNSGRDIKIGIYDDLINVVSPGAFPNTITLADLSEGRSEIRNKVLARVLKELNYIEQWGSGIRRIRSSCLAMGLKEPLIREAGDFVDVSLFRQFTEPDLVKENRFDLTDQEARILAWLGLNRDGITTKKAMEVLTVRERRARDVLRNMVAKKILDQVGSTTNSKYILKDSFFIDP